MLQSQLDATAVYYACKEEKERNCSFPSYNFSKINVGCVRGAPSSNNDKAWVVVKLSDYMYPS